MSATIQTDRFSSYISRTISNPLTGSRDSVPILQIAGQLYPIHGYYLEDIKSSMRELAVLAGPHVDRGEDDSSPTDGGIQNHRIFDGIPYRLMISLILRLSADTATSSESSQITSRLTGSVLVFLPGIAEIFHFISLFESLSPRFFPNKSKRFILLPLHGSLSNADQGLVFDAPPNGVIKIVVATNIAEASITIPDVTVVMDSCLVKEMSINPISKASSFSSLPLPLHHGRNCSYPRSVVDGLPKTTFAKEWDEQDESVKVAVFDSSREKLMNG
jgi:HrpA-like RNA helicase